jgi:Ion transport protein
VKCDVGEICGKMMDNPNLGNTNFDNILYSLLQVFVVTTMEGWTQTMGYVRDAFTDIAVIYFVLIVFIGAFFVMNIMLAVIKAKFTEVHEEQK